VGIYYEPLYELEKNSNNVLLPEQFIFKKSTHVNKINKIKTLLEIQNETNNISFHKILPIIIDSKYDIESIIIDKYFKGVGIFTKDNTIIHTLPFNVDFTYDFIYINKVPKLSVQDTIDKYSELYKFLKINTGLVFTLKNIVVENNKIHSVLNNNNKYIPCKKEDYKKEYKLVKIIEKYDDIDEILFNDILNLDKRIEENNVNKLKAHLYNNLKYEVTQFFKTEKLKLKEHLYFFIENNIIPIDIKREQVQKVIKSLIKNLILFDKPKLIDNVDNLNKDCRQLNGKDCEKNFKCKLYGLDGSKRVFFDNIDYNIDSKSCKFIMDTDYYDLLSESLSEEILKFYGKRKEILDGNYKIPVVKKYGSNIIELTGLNYIDKIRELYHQNKYLYVNEYFNTIFYNVEPSKKMMPSNVSNSKKIKLSKGKNNNNIVEKNNISNNVSFINNNNNNNNNNKSKLKTRYAVNFRYDYKKNKRILSTKAKGGDCIFPFKISKHDHPKEYDCVKGEEDSSWCATEIKRNLLKTKWGYCVPEGMTVEEYNRLYDK